MSDMEAGRALDARIAVEVFWLVPCTAVFHAGEAGPPYCFALPTSPDQGGDLKAYSTEIESAWLVVERLKERGWWFRIYDHTGFDGVRRWGASFDKPPHIWPGEAATVPLAICIAALAALAFTHVGAVSTVGGKAEP